MNITVLLGADIEIQTAYERQQTPRQADRLERHIDAALQQLAQFPFSSPPFEATFHRLVLVHFPFAIFYTVEVRGVFVHAFLDTRQRPETIRPRLGLA